MEHLPDESNAAESSSISVIMDALGAYLGKIPAALQRNVSKAVGHMFKVPNAYLDGLADEIKAASEARVKITKATGDKLAEAVQIDSSLAEIATHTHANKILRQQRNATKVLKYAAEEISNLPTDQEIPDAEIGDDWLNAFESEAVNMSSEQMQKLFGKMLAGEIRHPSKYSIRTVKLMGQMDTDIAKLFRNFASMTNSFLSSDGNVFDSRVITLGGTTSSRIKKFGIHWLDVQALAEYGLLSDATPFEVPYGVAVLKSVAEGKTNPLTYCGKRYFLVPVEPKTAADFVGKYFEYGIGLSRVGRELLDIVDFEENLQYTEALDSYFMEQGLEFIEMPR